MSGYDATARANEVWNAKLDQLEANRARYQLPDLIPIAMGSNFLTAWASTTAVTLGKRLRSNSYVWFIELAGTTGSTAPTSRDNYITDGTAILSFNGELAPVQYANSAVYVLGQRFYANGNEYRVTTAGTTSGSGAGPTGFGTGTDGTVNWLFVGPQRLPGVAIATGANEAAVVMSGLATTPTLSPSSANCTTLGGDAFDTSGGFGQFMISTVSYDGNTRSQAGCASYCTRTDAPKLSLVFYSTMTATIWVDGELVVYAKDNGTYNAVNLDFTGLPRKMRDIRVEATTCKFQGFYATGFDAFTAYTPASTMRAVWIGDSFIEPNYDSFGLAQILGRELGIEHFRTTGAGSTGILDDNTGAGYVNYTNRWKADVLNYAPDVVLIQLTKNDSLQSSSAVRAALDALVLRTQAELPNAKIVIVGVWNNRGALTGNDLAMNSDGAAVAALRGCQFVDWSNFLTDGGYVGTASGTGNSKFYTSSDGTHRSLSGHRYSAARLKPLLIRALEAF